MIKRILQSIANITVHHAGSILCVVVISSLILMYQAKPIKWHLTIDSLLQESNSQNKTFNQILDAFENDSNILLLATGHEDSLRSFAYRIKPLLESFDEWISVVHTQTKIDFLRKNILKIMKLDELDSFGEIFDDPNLVPFLININNAFENTYLKSNNGIMYQRDVQDVVDFLDRLRIFIKVQEQIMMETESLDVGQKAVDAIVFGEGLMFSQERDMLLIIIEPSFNMHYSVTELLSNVNGIEEIIDKTASQHGIKVGLAGPLVKFRNNYTEFLDGFWYIFISSLAGFVFILILFFRKWSIPLLCICTLFVSLLSTLGIYSLFLDAINLVSIYSILIFILLGLSNCILIISEFLEKRNQGCNIVVSMQETLQHVGSGIIIGGCVIGLVFLSLILSEIKILQDLGIMAGIGIITTTILSVIFLPAMLIINEKISGKINLLFPIQDISYPAIGKSVQWIAKYRWLSIFSTLFITGFLFQQGMQIHIDTDLSTLGSHDLDYISIEDELVKNFGFSSSMISIITDDLETARYITEQSREILSIGRVESITDYLPDEKFNDKKFRFLRELRRKIKSREVRKQLSSHDIKMYRKEIERLEGNVIELQVYSLLNDQFNIYEKTIQLVGDGTDSSYKGIITPFINALDTGMNRSKLTYFQERFSSAFNYTIIETANTEPLTLSSLPLEIQTRFANKDDNLFRINIYPNQDVWEDNIFLGRFVNEALSINEKMTGWPVLFIKLINITNDYNSLPIKSLLFSILLLLLIGLRSFKYPIIIIVTLITGLIWLMGVLILFNNNFILINLFIIPVILSIGMNNAIQICQRWKQEKNLGIVYRSTGKSILIITITIFAMALPLLFTNHTGLASIASVLSIGLWLSFLTHIIVAPPLLIERNSI